MITNFTLKRRRIDVEIAMEMEIHVHLRSPTIQKTI